MRCKRTILQSLERLLLAGALLLCGVGASIRFAPVASAHAFAHASVAVAQSAPQAAVWPDVPCPGSVTPC